MNDKKCAVRVKLNGDEVYWNCGRLHSVGDTVRCGGQSGTVLEVLDWLDIQDFPCVEEDASEKWIDPRFEIRDGVLLRFNGDEEEITVPNNVKEIAGYALPRSVKQIVLPESVDVVRRFAFANCTNLTSVTVDGEPLFEPYCLPDCSGLSYNEKNGYLYLGSETRPYAVLTGVRDPSVTEIDRIHSDCASIYGNAFEDFKELKRIVIPDGVTKLPPEALSFGSKMKKLEIGSGLCLDENILSEVRRTVKITLSPGNPYAKQAGKDIVSTDGTTLIAGYGSPLPEGIVTIGRCAFMGARKLGEIELPEGVRSIGSYAFGNTDVTSIVIPASVEHIAQDAFFDTDKLTVPIRYRGTRAQWKAAVEQTVMKEVLCEAERDPFFAKVMVYTITAKFSGGKKYRFNCDFAVKMGDRVRVSGSCAGEIGSVVQIDNAWTNRSTANHVTEVIR